MPQNIASRVTLILVVLFVGLFGFPPLADGIFSLARFVNFTVPFSEKLNLKPGIDIAGGYSLVYEIKPPPGGAPVGTGTGTLAEQVASVLKKRVDPTGTKNLIWRPQGEYRLEIQFARSNMQGQPGGSKAVLGEYRQLTDQLKKFNVSYGQVVGAVETMTGDQRKAALERLASKSKSREELFATLATQYDRLKAAETQLAAARKAEKKDDALIGRLAREVAEARIAYDDTKPRIEAANLLPADIEVLAGTPTDANKQALANLKARHPERKDVIEKIEQVYPRVLAAKGSVDDVAELKRLLKGSGVLEFHILAVQGQNISKAEYDDMLQRLQTEGVAPRAGDTTRWFELDRPTEFHYPSYVNPRDGKRYALSWVTPERSMTHREAGQDWALQRAYRTQGTRGDIVVGFEFNDAGAALFSQLTGGNVGQPLATILDGRIITAPNIRSQIGKNGTIDGGEKGYTDAELNYLINTLNAGSLPATLADEPISERVVGPQLGLSNLRAGLYACVTGLFIAAAFLVVYYHFAGLIAVLGLFMNLVIILGICAMMGATFTLPGIAALVLTIGMAVDANVLIFERLREEQLRGLSLTMALRNAYDRAFTAILDSNVTTAITSAFLIYFGSEEVKGFGLTLLVGILSSLFAALFVTKTAFALMITRFGLRKLGSLPLTFPRWNQIMHPKVDWMGKVPYFLAVSTVLTVLGVIAFVRQTADRKMFDVEFQSGTEVQFETRGAMSDGEVRDRIERERKAIPQPAVVAVGEMTDGKATQFSVVTSNADRKEVSAAIIRALGDLLKVDVPSKFAQTGASVDDALKAAAILPVEVKNGTFKIDGREVPDASAFNGGAAIVLRNLTPPLSPQDAESRIGTAVASAQGNDRFQQTEVVRLDGGDPAAPADTLVALVSNRNFDYAKGAREWRDNLAAPYWEVVSDAVGREASLQKVTNFNPQVAQTTQVDAILATLGSMVVIMIWIWVRFGDHKYGTGTLAAMLHDTVLVVGAIGLSHWLADTAVGRALGVEAFRINMTLVAAVLTVMGYSMVDTIVVFDRIRENRGKYGTLSRQLVNDSINQTLSRTLLTAGSTLLTLFVMYVWGGSAIHGFTFVLLIGIIIGTFSSIAVAAPILLIGARPPAGQKPKTTTGATGTAAGAAQKVGA